MAKKKTKYNPSALKAIENAVKQAKKTGSKAEKTLTKATKPAKPPKPPKPPGLRDMPPTSRAVEAEIRAKRADRRANRHYTAMLNIDPNSADGEAGRKRTGGDEKVPARKAPFHRGKGIGREHNLTAAEAVEQSERKARKAESRRDRLMKISETGMMPNTRRTRRTRRVRSNGKRDSIHWVHRDHGYKL